MKKLIDFFLVPVITINFSVDASIESSTKTAKLTIPKSIFQSDVGKIIKIFVLIAEMVSS